MNETTTQRDQTNVPLYQLRITLIGSRPRIWRRVVVRSDMPLDRLHDVIQKAMGWTDVHLHQFIRGSKDQTVCFGQMRFETDKRMDDLLNEKHYTLSDLAQNVKDKFFYEYDFGDSWQHSVVLEKILPPDPKFKCPVCLAGANACPPEDCGGIYGYYDMLSIIADPQDPRHQETIEWLGEGFDPARFSVECVNIMLCANEW